MRKIPVWLHHKLTNEDKKMEEQLEFDIIETDALPFDAVQDHMDLMDILATVADIDN